MASSSLLDITQVECSISQHPPEMHQQCTLHYLIDLPNYIHSYIQYIYTDIYTQLLPICVTGPTAAAAAAVWGGISNLIALPMASFWHISNVQPEKLISVEGMKRGKSGEGGA